MSTMGKLNSWCWLKCHFCLVIYYSPSLIWDFYRSIWKPSQEKTLLKATYIIDIRGWYYDSLIVWLVVWVIQTFEDQYFWGFSFTNTPFHQLAFLLPTKCRTLYLIHHLMLYDQHVGKMSSRFSSNDFDHIIHLRKIISWYGQQQDMRWQEHEKNKLSPVYLSLSLIASCLRWLAWFKYRNQITLKGS